MGQWWPIVRRIPLLFLWASVPVLSGALPRADPALQARLQRSMDGLGLESLVAGRKLSVSLLDLSDPDEERYASVNDRQIMYAASLPKLGILLGAFQAIHDGLLGRTSAVDASLTRMIRQSSNSDASRIIQLLGYDFIARTLSSARYRLYDPEAEGGMWVGKSYGPSGLRSHVEFWRPEPISGEWHATNSLQVTRFFWLLSRGDLVGRRDCDSMKRILSQSNGPEYFAHRLRLEGVRTIYRKSGVFGDIYCDAALVEHQHKRYVAVAMVNDASGPAILTKLIRELNYLIM